jgi:hypothetical protein
MKILLDEYSEHRTGVLMRLVQRLKVLAASGMSCRFASCRMRSEAIANSVTPEHSTISAREHPQRGC